MAASVSTPLASQAQAAEPQNALEMREQHLDLLAIAARLRKGFGLGERARDIARRLINAAQDLALPGLGKAVWQRAMPAVVHARKVGKKVGVADVAGHVSVFPAGHT
jgi:hypothetical protein